MKTETSTDFNEQQSILIIKEMIKVSQKKLKNDGILFIIWGWAMFITYINSYLLYNIVLIYPYHEILSKLNIILGLLALGFTVYYIYKQNTKVQTYIGISLRYVWISLIISLILINLIQYNVLHEIKFELQHPIFMTVIALATVITGGILRYKLIIIGGIIFAILAYICSYINLQLQLLIEALAWLIAFIIPGHILYSKREK